MQLFNDVGEKVAEFVKDNASTLLTAGGVVGTVATAVLTGRASFKAAEILEAAKAKKRADFIENAPDSDEIEMDWSVDKLSKTEKIMLVWPHFLPPVILGTATVGSIIMANRMSAQKAAALAAAYGMSQKHFDEYKKKVEEKLTGPKQQQIKDEIAEDQVRKNKNHTTIVVGDGEVLCLDLPTGRYFRSTMENIKQAVNATNAEIIHHDHASASYFYEELGLEPTSWTNTVGWNTDRLLELDYSSQLTDDGRPVITIDFKYLPLADYVPKHY